MSFDHWVFGPSFPSFLSPYYPSLRYVPCLKTTLRPWDQMSSSIASAWAGVWDLVAFYISSCFFFWETPFWWLDSFQLCLDYLYHTFVDGWFGATWFSDPLYTRCHAGAYFRFQTRFIDPRWLSWSSPVMGYVSGWGFDLILSWLSGWLSLVSFHQAHTFQCQCDFQMESSQAHRFSHRHFVGHMSDLLYIPIGLLMSYPDRSVTPDAILGHISPIQPWRRSFSHTSVTISITRPGYMVFASLDHYSWALHWYELSVERHSRLVGFLSTISSGFRFAAACHTGAYPYPWVHRIFCGFSRYSIYFLIFMGHHTGACPHLWVYQAFCVLPHRLIFVSHHTGAYLLYRFSYWVIHPSPWVFHVSCWFHDRQTHSPIFMGCHLGRPPTVILFRLPEPLLSSCLGFQNHCCHLV